MNSNTETFQTKSHCWDSNAETFRTQSFNFNSEDDDDDLEDDDANQWLDILEDFIDGVWIFKALLELGRSQPEAPHYSSATGNPNYAYAEVSVLSDESVPRKRYDMDQSDLLGDNDFVLPG
ncbi:hypothetical protein L2E82_49863 [Cichorium intybus]|uniref:Uncharacterized protein n=1 Tax=Cichorium intybus TaxID=13427 RepID=A0ACB8Z217_CICIN|nr:hypothetical protein L2E82_49863 [Cichorium intybus]